MSEAAPLRCSKPDCPLATTGSCVEGHKPLEACRWFNAAQKTQGEPEPADVLASFEEPTAAPSEAVISGDTMSAEGLRTFLLRRPARLVCIVGDRGSGKTTLLCTLYERFLKGPFANVSFCSTQTLLAFEKRAHESRLDSGRTEPETPRTSRAEGVLYFHLGLMSSNQERVDLMFSDRAGETYREARSDSAALGKLSEIAQADIVVFLVDGQRLAGPATRADALQSCRQSIHACLDADLLGPRSCVQVVLTKLDKVEAHPDAETIRVRLASLEEGLASAFASRLRSLTFWRIAARDPSAQLQPAHGVGELLHSWMSPATSVPPVPLQIPALAFEMDRLLLRTPGASMP